MLIEPNTSDRSIKMVAGRLVGSTLLGVTNSGGRRSGASNLEIAGFSAAVQRGSVTTHIPHMLGRFFLATDRRRIREFKDSLQFAERIDGLRAARRGDK